jgi:hypothetical protein
MTEALRWACKQACPGIDMCDVIEAELARLEKEDKHGS